MRRTARLWLPVLLLLTLLIPGAAWADDAPANLPDADRAAIQTAIRSQIDAFRRDDGAAAFGFASPGIQQMFGDAGTFMQMVRRGYAPVYRPGAVAFGALVEMEGKPVQRVELTAPDGTRDLALYFMEREPDGTWRIDGCMLVPSESVGA